MDGGVEFGIECCLYCVVDYFFLVDYVVDEIDVFVGG